jgi:hypothetical protein
LGKQNVPPPLEFEKNSENLFFGSWEVGLDKNIRDQANDFLPNLLGITIPKPPPLIPLDGLGGFQGGETFSPRNSRIHLGKIVKLDPHSDSQASEVIKYNLMPRTRGASIFSSGIVRFGDFGRKRHQSSSKG